MNKKVLQSLYTNICAKDNLYPVLCGVHFEEDRMIATDSHLLVIVKEGSKKFQGKTISFHGDEIEDRYPHADSVIPKKEKLHLLRNTDLIQLRDACKYHLSTSDTNEDDAVMIGDAAASVRLLYKLLSTLFVIDEHRNIKVYYEGVNPILFESTKVSAVLMPMKHEEANVDAPRVDLDRRICSYETFINEYVFNSWKKTPTKGTLDWAD